MKLTFSLLVIALTLGAVVLQTGCETQSAEANGLRVEPHAIGLRVNQTQEFTATGGFSYTWTLSDPSLGVLSRREGPTTTYTSRFNGSTGSDSNSTSSGSVIQHLTVTSTVGTDRQTTSTTDGSTNTTVVDSGFIDTAEAIIEHLPTVVPPPGPEPGPSAVSISPSAVSLDPSEAQSFVVSGGTAPYQWLQSGSTSRGTLSSTTGIAVTYTYSNTNSQSTNETVFLSVVDANSSTASAKISLVFP